MQSNNAFRVDKMVWAMCSLVLFSLDKSSLKMLCFICFPLCWTNTSKSGMSKKSDSSHCWPVRKGSSFNDALFCLYIQRVQLGSMWRVLFQHVFFTVWRTMASSVKTWLWSKHIDDVDGCGAEHCDGLLCQRTSPLTLNSQLLTFNSILSITVDQGYSEDLNIVYYTFSFYFPASL